MSKSKIILGCGNWGDGGLRTLSIGDMEIDFESSPRTYSFARGALTPFMEGEGIRGYSFYAPITWYAEVPQYLLDNIEEALALEKPPLPTRSCTCRTGHSYCLCYRGVHHTHCLEWDEDDDYAIVDEI